MEEVLDIYTTPYNSQFPVVCMDESSKQLTKEVRTPLPMKPKREEEEKGSTEINDLESEAETVKADSKTSPGQVEKYDTEYERNGTANIFMAFEPLQGVRFTKITDHRKRTDWAEFVKELVDEHYAEAEKIILVLDNLNTHTKTSLYKRFLPEEAKRIADRVELHYTPKHGSWLNMAEIELSHLSRQCLNRRIGEKCDLKREVQAWTVVRNKERVIANWQFTTEDARIKLSKLYPTI